MQYVFLFLIVLGVNLLPAFGPPTWTLLVFARLNLNMSPVALVVLGAIGLPPAGTCWLLEPDGSAACRARSGGRTWRRPVTPC